jgi:hypothetical protein
MALPRAHEPDCHFRFGAQDNAYCPRAPQQSTL